MTPRRPPSDPPGMDLRPDPARIRDTDDLLAALCDYRAWAGDPSYRKMAITAGQMVTATTMREALVGDRLPPLATVTAVLRGCGAAGEYEERFAAAWQRCSGAGDGAP